MVISTSECIPIEYIKDQIEEYRKFDHLGMYAEFLDMFIQDYKDNAMANYADRKPEPQTDGILFKGNLKEGDYKLIKTTDGWVLANEDIVYAGWERKGE